jgi:hypothetical protein
MKTARASAGALAVAASLMLLSACAGSSPSVTASNSPTAPATQGQSGSQVPAGNQPPPQLTAAQAGVIFNTYLPKFEELATNPSQASQLTTGPERSAQTFLKGQGPTPGALTGERFLVPVPLTSYPRWFLAAGKAATGQGFLFVMVQQSHSSPWQAAAELYDLSTPPQIMSDLHLAGFKSSGTFSPEPANDTSLTTEPSALSAAYASYLDHGAHGKAFLPGGYTTDYARSDRKTVHAAASDGWKFADQQSAENLPVYGLQFPSGAGAIVIFYTRDTVSWTANSANAKLPKSTTSSSPLPPAQFVSELHISRVQPGLRISASAIDENLAYVGPAGSYGTTIVVSVGKAISLGKS